MTASMLSIVDFQAESVFSGNAFENKVAAELQQREWFIADRNHIIPHLGIDVDMVCITDELELVFVECKGGKPGKGKRPGAQRTDSVKKAIANGALLKARHPDSIFMVVFSAKPKEGSASDKMIKLALNAGFVDAVEYLS